MGGKTASIGALIAGGANKDVPDKVQRAGAHVTRRRAAECTLLRALWLAWLPVYGSK